MDGLSANDDAAALSGISFSVDAVGQMQVVTSGGQAELGRAHRRLLQRRHPERHEHVARATGMGSSATIAFTATNALSGTKLPMHQNQFGGSVGGPLVRERTFFFANCRASRRSISPAW